MQESLHSYELQRDGFYRKIENIVVIFTQLSPLQTTNLWLLQIIMLLFNEQIHCQITVHRCKLDCYFIVLILVYRNFCTVNAAT